jgi:hypothetical protein
VFLLFLLLNDVTRRVVVIDDKKDRKLVFKGFLAAIGTRNIGFNHSKEVFDVFFLQFSTCFLHPFS